MRIGTRLVISLAAPLILLMVLFGYLTQQRSRRVLSEELAREGRAVTRAVQWSMEDAVRDGQLENTRELVDQITGYERLIGLRIFNPDGTIYYQSAGLAPHAFDQPEALATVLRERRPVETHRRIGEQPAVTFIFPLSRPGGALFGAVEILQDESFVGDTGRSLRNAIIVLTIVTILAMGAVLVLVTRANVSRPVGELMASFREVGAGNLSARVAVWRSDEFGRLARAFNQMGDRLAGMNRSLLAEQEERRRMEARLRTAERLAGLGRLAAGLAHEIGTPLNVIAGRADSLLRKLSGNEVAERNLTIISAQIDRIARIVRGMLDFAREREPRLASADVPASVRKVLDLIEPRAHQERIHVAIALPDDLPSVPADPDQLEQIFLNLSTNALDAMGAGGTLSVRACRVSRPHADGPGPAREFVAVAFEDTGTGIREEDLNRIFDPFFTTKEVGKGTGLGLSIAYGIAREHGGWIDVESRNGRGSRLTVYLPLEAGREPPAERGRIAS